MMKPRLLFKLCVKVFGVLFSVTLAQAATIHVPQDSLTIQGAIDAAVEGDTVLVASGTYFENINFHGKGITVVSEAGPETTIIDGRRLGSVITFDPSEGASAMLRGFTVQNGDSTFGGGISVLFSSPTILDNNIINNTGCGTGIGLTIYNGAPLIQRNIISHNSRTTACSGGPGGGGISILGGSYTQILDNIISDNFIGNGGGGGISIGGVGIIIRGNVIKGNRTSTRPGECPVGGGISLANFSNVVIAQNLITDNVACLGGGIHWALPSGSTNPLLVNNTIANNDSPSASGVFASGFDSRTPLINNIIVAKAGQTAISCNNIVLAPGVFRSNDIFSPAGSAYDTCPFQIIGIDGNISADPLFVDPLNDNYLLRVGSLAIDSGDNTAPALPATDLEGYPRIFDGDGVGGAIIDIGALEYSNRPPTANAGPDQAVTIGSDCVVPPITLDGRGSSDLNGDQLTFLWTGPFGSVSGPTPAVLLPIGSHAIKLTVDDGNGATAQDTVVITIKETTPPSITNVAATPSILLQANHQMVPVNISAAVSDCDSAVTCRIISVTSNEPIEGLGDGDTSPDWVITGNLTVDIRAERSAHGNGRQYTITVECGDSSGNRSTKTVTVSVPRNN